MEREFLLFFVIFTGCVSLAGIQPGLWSVKGGNRLIVEKLANDSHAEVIFQKAEKVELLDDHTFAVYTKNTSRKYDIVIIATPLTSDAKSPIEFTGFPNEIKLNGKYHRTVATIVHGKINHTYFTCPDEHSVPDLIISIGKDNFFNSVGKITPVNNNDEDMPVWKVFSLMPLKQYELNMLFLEQYETQVFDWLAYPHYAVYNTDSTNDTFILHEDLFYVNAVEWAASCMEMSVISGKNAAILAYKSLFPYEHASYQSYKEVPWMEFDDEL